MILHLRVPPGFGIAVEARSRPELSSRPVIMGGSPQSRGSVREANFPARSRGVQPGLVTIAQAHQYCPDGLFLTPDDALYAAVWEQLCAILRRSTPLVEPITLGEAALDLIGCPGTDDPARLAGEIAHAVRAGTGITPSLGVATNRLVAELASRDMDGGGITVVVAGQERAFLADLPLTALPGIDARLALTFQVLGLRTIGQFAALPRNAVRQRFGAPGEQLHNWSRGIDSRPVVPPAEEPAVRVRGECEEGTPEEAVAALHRLAGECAAELQRRNLAGSLVALTLTWAGSGAPSASTHELPVALSLAGSRPVALPLAIPDRSVALPLSGQDSAAAEQSGGKQTGSLSSAMPRCGAVPATEGRGYGGMHRGPGLQEDGSRASLPATGTISPPANAGEPQPPSIPTQPVPEQAFPIAYRIHSMLPQPGRNEGYEPALERPPGTDLRVGTGEPKLEIGEPMVSRPAYLPPVEAEPHGAVPFTTATALVRTPISTMPPLFERARDLLLRHWPQVETGEPDDPPRILHAIELAVSSFEQPIQLAFAELNRLDGIGRLRGMDPARRRAFEQTEEALATRYGDTSFRHPTHLDPANILTERRFRWEP